MDFGDQPDAAAAAAAHGGIPGAPSPQFAILNYLFPGFSVFSAVVNSYLGPGVGRFVPVVVAALCLGVGLGHARRAAAALVNEHFTSSVLVRTDDEVYNYVMLWLSRQRFAGASRHVLANTNLDSRNYHVSHSDSSDDDGGDDDSKPLHYTPAYGAHLFWFRGRPLFFERLRNRDHVSLESASEREELSLSCLGRSPRILKELLREARRMHGRRDERRTLIYRGNLGGGYWQRCMSRPNRPFGTVILDARVKREVVDDVADYLDPATRRWYANRGVPYRRGYLLHGPPGTGKSSLSLALAGHFRMKIYMVSLSSASATEEAVSALFGRLPTRCIVLLEDIDSAGITHGRDDPDAAASAAAAAASSSSSSSSGPAPRARAAAADGRLSLSGLLNILDGVASQEGRILIMTTNHVDKLDRALIRPGRVDMMIPFGLADADMASSMFRAMYAPHDDDDDDDDDAAAAAAAAGEEKRRGEHRRRARERIEELAGRFVAGLPEMEFSPAEIQGLLLRNKHSPEAAIAAVGDWVARMRSGRREQQAERAAEARREEVQREEAQREEQEPAPDGGEEDEEDEDDDDAPSARGGLDARAGSKAKKASDSGYETPLSD